MITRKIKSDELMEARNISALCFRWEHKTKGMTPEEYFQEEQNNPPTKESMYWQNTWASFTDQGEMMGCLSIPEYDVQFDGTVCRMAGIGGVCTYPQYRRSGVIRHIFENALPELYERGFDFSYLYAFSEAFYRKFGYEPVCQAKGWLFSMHTIPAGQGVGSFTLYRGKEDRKNFAEVYEAFAARYNMCVHREACDWGKLDAAEPFRGKTEAYLYQNAEGTAAGYLILETKDEDGMRILHCDEIVFDSFETLRELLGFAKSFQADYDAVRFRAPEILQLRYFCTDYSQSDSKVQLFQNGMGRVINVRSVLEKAHYRGSGKAVLRIYDTVILQNHRDFTVEFADGKCLSVLDSESREEQRVDIAMTVNQFTAAILGSYEVRDFEYLGLENEPANKEELKKIFYKKGCWINNFF